MTPFFVSFLSLFLCCISPVKTYEIPNPSPECASLDEPVNLCPYEVKMGFSSKDGQCPEGVVSGLAGSTSYLAEDVCSYYRIGSFYVKVKKHQDRLEACLYAQDDGNCVSPPIICFSGCYMLPSTPKDMYWMVGERPKPKLEFIEYYGPPFVGLLFLITLLFAIITLTLHCFKKIDLRT